MTRPVNALAQTSDASRRSLAPAPGVTPPRPDGPTHRFLSDAIVARGLVDQATMDAALRASRSGRRYSEILVNNGKLSADDLARTLADHHGIDHIDLDVFPIDAEIKALVPPDTAVRLGALPVAQLSTNEVVLALYDPEALLSIAEIANLIGRDVRPAVATRAQVEGHALGSTGGEPAPSAPAAAAASPEPPAVQPVAAPVAIAPAAPPVHIVRAPIASERVPSAGHTQAPAPYRDEPPPAGPSAIRLTDVAAERAATGAAQAAAPGGARNPVAALERRLADAEGRARTANERASTADARALEAERRAAAAREQARDAGERVRIAEKHAEGLSAAATAANEALAQLAQARLIADQTARASAREIDSLSRELDTERAERRRLESELQRRSWHAAREAPETRPEELAAPAPPPAAQPIAAPAAAPQPVAEQPAAAATPAATPQPVAASAPTAAPQPVAEPPAAAATPAATPQPVAAAAPAAAPQPVAPPAAGPRPAAPAAAVAQPALNRPAAPAPRPVNRDAASKKARGLRRMIAALRR